MRRVRRVRARGCMPQCPSVAAVFSWLHDSEQQQPQCPGALSLGKPGRVRALSIAQLPGPVVKLE